MNDYNIVFLERDYIEIPRQLAEQGSFDAIGIYCKLILNGGCSLATKDMASVLGVSALKLKDGLSELERLGLVTISPKLEGKSNVGFVYDIKSFSPVLGEHVFGMKGSPAKECSPEGKERISPYNVSNTPYAKGNPTPTEETNPTKVKLLCPKIDNFDLGEVRWTFAQFWKYKDGITDHPDFIQLCQAIKSYCPWCFKHLEVGFNYYTALRKKYDNKELLIMTESIESYKKRNKYKNWGIVVSNWFKRRETQDYLPKEVEKKIENE